MKTLLPLTPQRQLRGRSGVAPADPEELFMFLPGPFPRDGRNSKESRDTGSGKTHKHFLKAGLLSATSIHAEYAPPKTYSAPEWPPPPPLKPFQSFQRRNLIFTKLQ